MGEQTEPTMVVSVIDRLFSRTVPEPNGGCWLWDGAVDKEGYGRVSHPDWRRGTTTAHRLAYEVAVGRVPDGLVLDHLCRVRCCINPLHLEAVSVGENNRRGTSWSVNSGKTQCPHGHEYTEQNTYIYRGRRHCRACNLVRTHRKRGK